MNDLGRRLGFLIDPSITFLNHGSFGACPEPVLAHRRELERRFEREPVRFFYRDYPVLLDETRRALAAFVKASLEGLSIVRNATAAVSAVLRSLVLDPGDELVITSHAYNACRVALQYVADRTGANVVTVELPLPILDEDAIVATIKRAITPRTKLALLDHVASPTGVVFPIARLVRELGVDVLVDGAHAPGMLELDVDAIGAAYYTGNCHKWMCAPKGAAFLHVRADRRDAIVPSSLSHGVGVDADRHRLAFDWTGTDDPTSALCIEKAIEHLATALPGGWPELRARNRALAIEAQAILCDALGVEPQVPPSMLGTLVAVPLPDSDEPSGGALYQSALQQALLDEDSIEVPIIPWPSAGKRLVRVSAAIHNERRDYEVLAKALVRRLRRA